MLRCSNIGPGNGAKRCAPGLETEKVDARLHHIMLDIHHACVSMVVKVSKPTTYRVRTLPVFEGCRCDAGAGCDLIVIIIVCFPYNQTIFPELIKSLADVCICSRLFCILDILFRH